MLLDEICAFAGELFQVRVYPVTSGFDWEGFCGQCRFHRVQDYLTPHALGGLLGSLNQNQILDLNDDFQIRFLFARGESAPFVFGPYCSESLSRWDARILLERCGIAREYDNDLLAWRGAFPVIPHREALRIVRLILSRFCDSSPAVRVMDMQSPPLLGEIPVEQTYAESVNERYAIERDLMLAVERGDAEGAVTHWRHLHRRMDFIKKQMGYSLETSRNTAGITRTAIRLAAMRTRLPPVVIDAITGEFSRKNLKEDTIDGIEANTEELIRVLCREIKRQRYQNGSYLAVCVQHELETRYAEAVSIAGLAEKMELSESYLIAAFRKETGATPGAYLNSVRMSKAAELLAGTRKSVQEIAADVGVPDANYFVKLFRKSYGVTPSAWRKRKDGLVCES